MQVINFTDKAPLTEKDAEQMKQAINAFQNGEQQPEGRFIILDELKSEETNG
jgi:hypothetical protein